MSQSRLAIFDANLIHQFIYSIKLNIAMKKTSEEHKFYQTQNIALRKKIRELDLLFVEETLGSSPKKIKNRSHMNILVVGPNSAGKSSLLRTMHYAFNGTINPQKSIVESDCTFYELMDIKKNKRNIVKGCSQLSESYDKFGISSIQLSTGKAAKNPFEAYRRASLLINQKLLTCIKEVKLTQTQDISCVVVALSMVDKIRSEDLVGLRYLIGELEEKRLPYLIVGTKVDLILGPNSKTEQAQPHKLEYIESWKQFIMKQLNCQASKMILVENYKSQKIQASEIINFYSLSLLHRVVRMVQEENNEQTKIKDKMKFMICSC